MSRPLLVALSLAPLISLTISTGYSAVAYVAGHSKKPLERKVSEKRLGQIDLSSIDPNDPDDLTVSPDGKRVAYTVKVGEQELVAVNGQQSKPYSAVSEITFSPDSRRLAYAVRIGKKEWVVVDGKQGKPYDAIVRRTIIFESPD